MEYLPVRLTEDEKNALAALLRMLHAMDEGSEQSEALVSWRMKDYRLTAREFKEGGKP